jgi:hypothetical protein
MRDNLYNAGKSLPSVYQAKPKLRSLAISVVWSISINRWLGGIHTFAVNKILMRVGHHAVPIYGLLVSLKGTALFCQTPA